RKRWPSTESIAQILQATNTPLDDFVALAVNDTARTDIPLATWADAQQAGMFEDGAPVAVKWSALRFPVVNDARAFALEITGAEFGPLYRDGDRIVISPAEKPRRGDRVLVRLRTGELKLGQLGRDTAQKIELASFASGQSDISRTAIEWIYRILWASQ
ncbi:MAG TPA: S24 family peptidase, partial [Alphaproteobacteria bacterium]|nr:S24 family peptidase [Alphaproteobacteria bacterium]